MPVAENDMVTAFSSPADNKVIVIDPGHGGFDSVQLVLLVSGRMS